MLERILPPRIDNDDRGLRAAIWLYAPVLLMKTAIALGTIFNGRNAAQGADGVPLASLGAAADTVVALYALWGLGQLVICGFGWLALVRYRALLPLMLVALLFEQLARKAILAALPIPSAGGTPGFFINLALAAALAVGLALSLRRRRDARPPG